MKRLIALALFAFTFSTFAQLAVYTGSLRGNQYGYGGIDRVALNAILIVDLITHDTVMIVYGRDSEDGGKFQELFSYEANPAPDSIFDVGDNEVAYVATDIGRDRIVENWAAFDYNTVGSLFEILILLQGAQLPAPVSVGYEDFQFRLCTALNGVAIISDDSSNTPTAATITRNASVGIVNLAFRLSVPFTRQMNDPEIAEGVLLLAQFYFQQLLAERYGYEPGFE